jgi:hypothetical protein
MLTDGQNSGLARAIAEGLAAGETGDYAAKAILLTGGAGFIASHVAIRLVNHYPHTKAGPASGVSWSGCCLRSQAAQGCEVNQWIAAPGLHLGLPGLSAELSGARALLHQLRGTCTARLRRAAHDRRRWWCWTSWTTAPP